MERQARHLRFIFVLCGLFFLSGTGRVVASEDKAGLVLRPLRDRGGIERGLNRRLTDALKKFLGEHSDFLSKTEISERKIEDAPLTPSCYILTGEISFARAQSESEGRYFLVLRLFRGESRRTLVGQWAGTSDSFRYLTANLRQTAHLHPYGLIGELGTRVLETLKADWNRPERRWLSLLAQVKNGEPLAILPSEGAFRAELPASRAESAFLLTFDETGKPTLIALMSGTDPNPRHLSQPFALAETNQEVWVLWRIATVSAQHTKVGRFLCTQAPPTSENPPVSVLDGVGAPQVFPTDVAQEALLKQIALQSENWCKSHVLTARKSP